MPRELRGTPPVDGQYAIVVARYNEPVTRRLLEGAIALFAERGVPDTAIDVAWVPGAFELPLVADRLAASQGYSAVICLGAVIRGDTTHDQHINRAVSLALMASGLRYHVPVMFGVLTCDSLEQALQRAGGSVGHKGREAAEAALEMAALLAELDERSL